jgi:DNA-binding NtrC family response regulator
MNAEILVVDDHETIRHFITRFLTEQGKFNVYSAAAGEEGMAIFRKELPDLVILDLKLPDIDGLEVLKRMKAIDEDITVIIITAFGQIDTAVEAMKSGAYDYITKPISMDHLLILVEKALETKQLIIELNHHRKRLREEYKFDRMIGNCDKMKEIHRIIDQVAKSSTTSILIEGESGTGKELVANIIHYKSDRCDKPFMEINCASLPETLLESELFGHEKGAFTDAKSQKRGLLELADKGTLFLDEVGEMNLSTQVKLLRVLERMTFKRVGGVKDISVDVRIISATNKQLAKSVEDSAFREDLYYRLKVVPIVLPPLRERKKDIIILAKYFLKEYNRAFNKQFKGFSPEAEQVLLSYHWPGNVRELKNVLERTILLEDGELITPTLLPENLQISPHKTTIVNDLDEILKNDIPTQGILFDDIVEGIEKSLILKALHQTNWNQSETAELLNIKRDKLRYRIKLFGLKKQK